MSITLSNLKNTYLVMRHGKSQANHEEIIISTPERGVCGYGLTEEGKEQARESAAKAKAEGVLDETTIFVSSDFARAHETALIASEVLGAGEVQISPKLRERNFGHYEGTHNSNYEKVWEKDGVQELHPEDTGVENAADVQKRALSLIEELEGKYEGKNIVLVSHGDTLQILLTAFGGISAFDHRSQSHLQTAEIRRCN